MRITFDLKRDSLKAKFIPPDRPDLVYLIDTGADTPVWCKGLEELLDVFPGAEKKEPKYILSGFGREPEIVDLAGYLNAAGAAIARACRTACTVSSKPPSGISIISAAGLPLLVMTTSPPRARLSHTVLDSVLKSRTE